MFLLTEGMEAVAKFYASRKKNDTPSHSVADSIVVLVRNVALQEGVSKEKVFGLIEETGLLGQFIRCVPVVDTERSTDIVKCLQGCLQLVKKKLKSGTRTGDILDAVIAGKDGPINDKAKSTFTKLQSLARLSNNIIYDKESANLKSCRHCEMLETQMDNALLMKCQRCKAIYYCSKECQVADWKRHKETSSVLSSHELGLSTLKTTKLTLWAFIKSKYFDIAKEVYKKTQEYNVTKKELFLEFNFYGDTPALRNEFKVWLTSNFFDESALEDVPDWFDANTKNKIKPLIREQYEQVTSNDLLELCLSSNSTAPVLPLHFPVSNTSYQHLSDEYVESIGREDYVRMMA